jgi:hypothetical protein
MRFFLCFLIAPCYLLSELASRFALELSMMLLVVATRGLVLSSGLAAPARAGVPIAALSEPPSATGDFPADLSALTRRELQQLAKRLGVRANQKSVDMITELQVLVPKRETGSAAKRSEASAAEPRSEQGAPERRQASAPERRQASAPERRQASAPERGQAIAAEPQTRFSGSPSEVSPSRRRKAAAAGEPALPPASVRQGSLSLVERTLPTMLTRSRRLTVPSAWRHCAPAWHPGPGSPASPAAPRSRDERPGRA